MATARRRALPEWMQPPKALPTALVDKTNDQADDKSSTERITKATHDDAPPAEKRYQTRSTAALTKTVDCRKPEPRKPKPFIDFKGKVEYATTMIDIACMADDLLNWVNKHDDKQIPIAFDMEWPFSFQTGSGKTSVIQLCADVNVCFVFHVFEMKRLPASLVCLLNHDKVILHGVNIKNDFRKLERDFPDVKVQKMIDQCVDLGPYCNDVMGTGGRWSMANLVSYICKLQINKDRKVRMSQWHVMPLTQEQQIYAAIDVYISQVIYYELKRREIKKDEEAKKFIEEYGEHAYDAVQKLM